MPGPLSSLVLLLSALTATQDELPRVSYPSLPSSAADAAGFAPSGWRVESQSSGDLDGDGRADLAFVLRMQDPANILDNEGLGSDPFDTNPRILAVALARPQGGYRLIVQDHALIPRPESPAQQDPFESPDGGLRLVRDTVRVDLYRFMSAGGWDAGPTRFTFRWQAGALRLIGYDYNNVHRGLGCLTTLSVNYLTRRARLAAGYIDEDAEQVRWRRLAARPLLAIGEIGDGFAFDPDGLVGNFPLDCPERDDG